MTIDISKKTRQFNFEVTPEKRAKHKKSMKKSRSRAKLKELVWGKR